MVMKFGTDIDLDDLSDEFAGQGYRSMVKVTRLKKRHFQDFLIWVNKYQVLAYGVTSNSWRHMTSWGDIIAWRLDVIAWGRDVT